ncbi:TPA: PagK family vesicle-borne virulence factor [Salmonella enterica subsp. enterica]
MSATAFSASVMAVSDPPPHRIIQNIHPVDCLQSHGLLSA